MTLSERRRGYPGWRAADAPARVDPKDATSRAFRISYDDVGKGAPIVLVNGFTLSGGDWWETGYVQRLVALGRRVLIVDPLGHGQSDRPHDPALYRWPDVALDIVAAMDAARVQSATLWGYSRGAALVATAAVEAPERVDALIVGGGGDLTQEPDSDVPPAVQGLLGGDWEAYWATPIGSTYSEADRGYCERVNDPQAFGAAQAGRRLSRYQRDLTRVSAPALVYVGGNDDPEDSQTTARALRTECNVLAGRDHGSAITAVDEVFAFVEPFLALQRSNRGVRPGVK